MPCMHTGQERAGAAAQCYSTIYASVASFDDIKMVEVVAPIDSGANTKFGSMLLMSDYLKKCGGNMHEGAT